MEKRDRNSKGRDWIIIRGARTNNLKAVDVDIPRNKLVVITGLSGSGKSSLAFDTIYAEGNRRYMEGLSSYARNFLDVGAKPDADKIENLSPTVAIDQKSISRSPRSTVGTLTEIYDYLRILFSKAGRIHCPYCGSLMQKKNSREIAEEIVLLPEKSQVAIIAPLKDLVEKEKNIKNILRQVGNWGYARIFLSGKVMAISEALLISNNDIPYEVGVVIDRLITSRKNFDRERIIDSIETSFKLSFGSVMIWIDGKESRIFNQDFVCSSCGMRVKEITPRHFSFNSPEGACPECLGLGFKLKVNPELVIPNKNLSLLEGAIKPWNKSEGRGGNSVNFSALNALAKEYGFSLKVPVRKLKPSDLDIILYGLPGKKLEEKINDMGGVGRISFSFEGVIPLLEKKYREAKSDYLRSEIEKYMICETCPLCRGKRIKKEYLSVLINNKSIDDIVNLDILSLQKFFSEASRWEISESEKKVVHPLTKEIMSRIGALENVGLEYLNLARSSVTLSGGEAQRIRLTSQINARLMGIIYVLDEPSIGLHSRDTEKLIRTIRSLKEAGNSMIIVEHDESIIRAADWIIDMGPGAGEEGGEVIFSGDFKKLSRSKTLTADYLLQKKKVQIRKNSKRKPNKHIEVIGASENNLKNISIKIPLGNFVSICGVSGSGKSTLVNDILAKALSKHFYGAKADPGKYKKIKGLENIDKVINIDQSPIGRTPRSNAATYTGVFSHIRDIFADLPESKSRGYTASRFSFNMRGGRCEICQGEGQRKIEMHLLPDIYVKCEACGGTRYSKKTLEIEYKGYNVAQVLDMNVSFALRFFSKFPLIAEKLKTMEEVGLGYLKLGQSATDLSGGEAQRIKLSAELARKSTGKTLYILDEPTIGLHFEDVQKLLQVLNDLVERKNTVLVVEHNLDVIKNSDWAIELGPEGGDKGGEVVFEGLPEKLKKCKRSWTGKYL